jgi:alpha-tubulin suppressor-like RCC1 family protein
MPDGVRFTTIGVGMFFGCGLSVEGKAFCWGFNLWGALGTGDGTDHDAPFPVAMPPGIRFTSLSVGSHHTCASGSDGYTYCWGSNIHGAVGDGTERYYFAYPTRVLTPPGTVFRQVTAGEENSCGTTSGALYCWGGNFMREVGDGGGPGGHRFSPVMVAGSR